MEKLKTNDQSSIRKVIAVLSGKGGVGKSLVSCLLASSLKKQGYRVGILDADITGPSIPKAFGITDHATSDGVNMVPQKSKGGIQVMSVNLILDNPASPVLWRAPIISKAIRQFYENVSWGDLDFLLVDMPPGTGDVALTVFQSLPVDGLVLVTTPQDLVELIVEKSANMASQMNIPILGLVENMSYFTCPHCGEKTEIYGPSKVQDMARRYGIDKYLQLPINPDFAKKVDQSMVEYIDLADLDLFALSLD